MRPTIFVSKYACVRVCVWGGGGGGGSVGGLVGGCVGLGRSIGVGQGTALGLFEPPVSALL
jgi:hypothetical protein